MIIDKTDRTGEKRIAFATGGALAMPHLPQMYGLTDLYFAAALAHAPKQPPAAGTEIKLRQYYIDREFDRFPLHEGIVRVKGGGNLELEHDWLAGYGDATVDSANHMLTYNGARSTYKVEVTRLGEPLPDIEAIGERFAALETSQGGMKQLSVRDTVRATIGKAVIWIDYGRPLARGRQLLGGIIPYGEVWRTGANAATQFSTSAPVTIAGMKLAPGMYTLWTVPSATGVELIVNKQSGQWGTGYDPQFDLGKSPMMTCGGQDAGGEVHDLDRSSGCASRNAGDGMGAVPLDARRSWRRSRLSWRRGAACSTISPLVHTLRRAKWSSERRTDPWFERDSSSSRWRC